VALLLCISGLLEFWYKINFKLGLMSLSVLCVSGQECSFKDYVNQYTSNQLALNKHQHNEDRDRRRYLSHKFSLTPASEFRWSGNVFGARTLVMAALRMGLTSLEAGLPAPFLHTNWPLHRANWLKAVNMCQTPRDFAFALAMLESCIKPVLFNNVWHDALGTWHGGEMHCRCLSPSQCKIY
jgi:nucleosome-remodeling factor subunit BPTF